MAGTTDCPPLALDDLLHLMSPSPTLDDPASPQPANSPSPEPLLHSDIAQMRARMRRMSNADPQLTVREKELADMVLRLTAVVRPDPDQILRQAELISALIQQRDLLLHQFEEQRLRWNSEKDGWARMAEALLAQQAKNRLNSDRNEDYERLQAAETDNKTLRQRLHETQSRLQMLESELTRLRPLLLMQPLMPRSSFPPPTPNSKTQHGRRRKKDATATEDEDHGRSEDEPQTDPFDTPHTSQSQPTPRAKSRKSEVPSNPANPHKRRPSHKAVSRGFSADAKAEHLLLAARKIGKHRAGIMAGMVQHLEERERDRRREESAATAVASTPKTPKRNVAHVGYPPEAAYVYGQIRPGPGMQPVPVFIPAYPPHLLQTPSSSTTAASVVSPAQQSAHKAKQDTRTNNPPTPLDSLLSAARTMMHEDIDAEDEEVDVVGDSPGKSSRTHHARPRDLLGSPVPKRRRVAARADDLTDLTSRTTDNASTSSLNTGGQTSAGAGRIRSALDVLADQAAAFSSQDAVSFPTQPQAQTKGKGKERADPQPQQPSDSTPKARGKAKARRKEQEVDAPSSAASTPRSRTPRSDMGDNLGGPTLIAPPASGTVSEALVDPGGGTGSASTSQILDSIPASQATHNNNASSHGLLGTSACLDDSDTTPRQARIQPVLDEERSEGSRGTVTRPNLAQPPVSSIAEDEHSEVSPLPSRSETAPSGGENGGVFGLAMSALPAKNKELARVAEQAPPPALPTKRQRSPYVKWSKEEDDLLAQAVAKYGQKWDLVQKALPSRGYHQVRQRWLRKLGVFDSKPDLSSLQTAANTFPSTSRGDGVEPRGNPKLGLAPLSSEKAFSRPSSTLPS